MEKQPKPMRPGGKKRQRKVSLTGGASESKHIKLDLKDNGTKLKTLSPEKKQIKPNKSNIEALPTHVKKVKHVPSAKAITNLKPLSANAKMVSKKNKLGTVNALTVSTNALNGSASVESMISTDTVVEANPPYQAKTSKKIKPKLNGNQINQKKKKKMHNIAKEVELKVETVQESVTSDKEESTENTAKIEPVAEALMGEIHKKFPILKDKDIIERFLKVPLNNNQKGRIRQSIKLSLQGTSNTMFPEIINGKIQAILSSTVDLTDSELRRIRILYNMLKTALEAPEELVPKSPQKKKKKEKTDVEKGDEGEEKKERQEEAVVKVKGPKRYVVFLGNLPLDVTKEKIMDHFRELNEQIKDVRVPKVAEGTKSAIAYVELTNEPSYELALSKHHSMMDNKRIKVLYSTQQNSKISRSAAKGKSAKLIALQKSGKLVGSTPHAKKRSHRRAIMKKAKASEAPVDA